MNRTNLGKIIGLLVSALVLLLMISRSGSGHLLQVLSSVSPVYLLLLFTLQVITILASALLWHIPLNHGDTSIPFAETLKINLSGSLVESITPSVKFGGEAVKLVLFKKSCGCSASRIAALTAVHTYLWMMPFMVISSLLLLAGALPEAFSGPWIYGIALLLVAAPAVMKLLRPLRFSRSDIPMAMPLILSTLMWLLYPVKTMISLSALGIQGISYVQAAGAVFSGYLVGLLPLFPGGLGGFEASMAYILTQHGLLPAEASAAALVTRLGTFWFPLVLSLAAALSLARKSHSTYLQPAASLQEGGSL